MNNFAISLDLSKRFSSEVVIIRQSDHDGTQITATLYDHGTAFTASGYSAYCVIRHPSGGGYYRKAATYSSGVITHTVDEEFAGSVPGEAYGYFELHYGSTVIASTATFKVLVLPSATAGSSEGQRYDDEIVATIEAWLADHPEATTTVTDDSITAAKLKADSVTTAKIQDGAVTGAKLADGAVLTAKLADGSVTGPKLATGAVTTGKIADGAVTPDKMSGVRVLTNQQIDEYF